MQTGAAQVLRLANEILVADDVVTSDRGRRAQMRVIVKRILWRSGYQPDKQARAAELVLRQAEAIAWDWVGV